MRHCFINTMFKYKNYFTIALYFILSYIIIFDNNKKVYNKNDAMNDAMNDKNTQIIIQDNDIDNDYDYDYDYDLHWGQFKDIEVV